MTAMCDTKTKLSKTQLIKKIQEYDDSDFILSNREKNLETMKKYDISNDEMVEYIKSLKVKNFKDCIECNDDSYKTDYLYEFLLPITVTGYDGLDEYIKLYIKIGFHNSRCVVYVVSFHDNELINKR